MRIFGNRKLFGIRYLPGWKSKDGRHQFATLHLILGNQIIGNPEEVCLVGTWLARLENILRILQTRTDKLFKAEFINKTDREVFELIFKSNQLDEEFDPKYSYLEQLDSEVWQFCSISIDETTDSYKITMTADKKNNLKFIWKNLEKNDKLHSVEVKIEVVEEAIKECLLIVNRERENYKIKN